MQHKKKILVFAGPSGVGKSTLCSLVHTNYPTYFSFAISATTRAIRGTEIDGVDYYFLSEEAFKKNIQEDAFVEWEEVYEGRYYGTLRSEISRISDLGKITLLDIDVLGALNIKKQYGDDVHIIFVKPESLAVLKERLIKRGNDSEEDIAIRVQRFEKELSFEPAFDSVLVNHTGKLEDTKQALIHILETLIV